MSDRVAHYLRRHHLALLALFVALGGTSYAAIRLPANSVGARQLKANSVNSGKVRDGSLTARDFATANLPMGPAGPVGTKGDAGPKGEAGPKGDTGPAGLTHVITSSGPDGSFPQGGGLNLATLHLAAGSYVLYAHAVLQNTTADRVTIECELGAPGLFIGARAVDVLQVDLQPGAFPEVARLPISLIGAITLTQNDAFPPAFACASSGPSGSVNFFDVEIGAIQVAAVN
jgi:hypothetical protein